MGNWNQPPGYGPPPPASQEPVFFQDQCGVYVSRSRVVLNGVTFPVNGITAVYARKIPKSLGGLIFGILCAVSSLAFCGPGVMGVASGDQGGQTVGGGCLGLGICDFLLGAGLIAIFIWIQKVNYVLVIATAGREVTAITHTDWRYIGTIVEAINNALASRV